MNQQAFDHPHDTPLSAGFRFFTELIAWVAGPWAVWTLSPWASAAALVILVGLPSVFSTIGDKNNVLVATPGPARAVLELLLYLVAAVAPWCVWSAPAALAASTVVALSLALGWPRLKWLIRGAPL